MWRSNAGSARTWLPGIRKDLPDSSKGVPAEEVLPRIKARRGARKGRWDLVRVVFTPLAERQIEQPKQLHCRAGERGARVANTERPFDCPVQCGQLPSFRCSLELEIVDAGRLQAPTAHRRAYTVGDRDLLDGSPATSQHHKCVAGQEQRGCEPICLLLLFIGVIAR